ncbi:MAG TPA: potassium channel family protein [Actinomycetes bacterium]|nr:potassium channel family protein [Actinomycetes bacterium]
MTHADQHDDQHRPPSVGRKQIVLTLIRMFLGIASLLFVYFMFPLTDQEDALTGFVAVVGGLTVFGVIFIRQLGRIRKAEYPMLRAAESITLVGTLFIILMATCATGFALADASNYSEDLSRMDALYFTVTTLATVGFGDITPTSATTRAFTTFQIVLGVGLLGVGLRALVTVAQSATKDRDADAS